MPSTTRASLFITRCFCPGATPDPNSRADLPTRFPKPSIRAPGTSTSSINGMNVGHRNWISRNGSCSPTWHPLKNFTFASVVTLASGRPYTAVFDTSALNFSVVPNEPFNGFRGPGQEVIDFSVARLFRINERIHLKVVAEAFDLFNHPNFQQNNINNVQYATTQ